MLDLHLQARRIKATIKVVGVEKKWGAQYVQLEVKFLDAYMETPIFGGPRTLKVGKRLVYTFPSDGVLMIDGSIKC